MSHDIPAALAARLDQLDPTSAERAVVRHGPTLTDAALWRRGVLRVSHAQTTAHLPARDVLAAAEEWRDLPRAARRDTLASVQRSIRALLPRVRAGTATQAEADTLAADLVLHQGWLLFSGQATLPSEAVA